MYMKKYPHVDEIPKKISTELRKDKPVHAVPYRNFKNSKQLQRKEISELQPQNRKKSSLKWHFPLHCTYLPRNGYIEGNELDKFLIELVTSVNTQDIGLEDFYGCGTNSIY
ncbi:hypothetical protein KUTeg_019548 [Tegillarca granosa]|uniref:Uncharacterized protein n=1 Tax=Tegillarca granosa TaxID=220873 RepID=A0ABQ9EGW6_TEGGR|nr:hypothetical protein KUTeg_019548 [Tegillarca granosa]